MDFPECVKLCRYVKALVPAQAFDEYTPDAWFDVLKDYRLEDAKEAVRNVKTRERWVDPSDIIAEVKRIRRKRIDEYGPIPPPPDLDPDDWRAFQSWLKDTTRAIGDGTFTPPAELVTRERPVKQLTQRTFKEPK